MKHRFKQLLSFLVFLTLAHLTTQVSAQTCFHDDNYCGFQNPPGGEACYHGIDNDCVRSDAGTCGDGQLNPGEVCDNDGVNSDSVPDQCRTDCRAPRCGDDIIDTGVPDGWKTDRSWPSEVCDDGGRNSDFQPNACREDCSLPICGDAVVDNLFGEACDEGAGNSDLPNATCSTQCFIPGCGNGILETWEQCDDGNLSDNDGCTGQCRYNVCGDGFVAAENDVEMCEYESAWDRGECRYDCGQAPGLCGNGVVDTGEGCDDGADRNNNEANNPCRTDCQLLRCGDGIVDTGEQCDLQQGCAPDCTWDGRR